MYGRSTGQFEILHRTQASGRLALAQEIPLVLEFNVGPVGQRRIALPRDHSQQLSQANSGATDQLGDPHRLTDRLRTRPLEQGIRQARGDGRLLGILTQGLFLSEPGLRRPALRPAQEPQAFGYGQQPTKRVVLPQQEPVLRPRSEQPIGLVHSLGNQIIDQHADHCFVTPEK